MSNAVAAAAAVVALAFPLAANAQLDQTIGGTIASYDGHYTLRVIDADGVEHVVRLHQGTVTQPQGLALAAGMDVFVTGFVEHGVLEAEEIDQNTESSYDNGNSDYAATEVEPYTEPALDGYDYWDWAALGFGLGYGYWGCCGWGAPFFEPVFVVRPPGVSHRFAHHPPPSHPGVRPHRTGFSPPLLSHQWHAFTALRPGTSFVSAWRAQGFHPAYSRFARPLPRYAHGMPMHFARSMPMHFARPAAMRIARPMTMHAPAIHAAAHGGGIRR